MEGKGEIVPASLFILVIFVSLALLPFILADTLTTRVTVGNVGPVVYNVKIDGGNASIDLSEGTNRTVFCNATVNDSNGWEDVASASGILYKHSSGSDASDDRNNHYSNSSCNTHTGSGVSLEVSCYFDVDYFADNATWSCNISALDTSGSNSSYENVTMNSLVGLNIPSTIDYGTMNPGETSDVNKTNVTNTGNKQIDIKVYGYANGVTTSDYGLNCTGGTDKNISLGYEQYNVTDPQCANVDYGSDMVNLTNSTNEVTWTQFDLAQRTDESEFSTKYTCWVLKIPSGLGVSGTCTGRVVFTAQSG